MAWNLIIIVIISLWVFYVWNKWLLIVGNRNWLGSRWQLERSSARVLRVKISVWNRNYCSMFDVSSQKLNHKVPIVRVLHKANRLREVIKVPIFAFDLNMDARDHHEWDEIEIMNEVHYFSQHRLLFTQEDDESHIAHENTLYFSAENSINHPT